MKIIELIGPSGVGKSTFYRELKQEGMIAGWPVPEEAAQRMLRNHPDTRINFSLGDRFLLERKLNSPRLQTMTAIEKYDYLGFCFRKMKAEALVREAHSPEAVFGENHIFHGFNGELLALAQRGGDHFRKYLNNRKFILLRRPHRVIIENRLKRKESGEYRPGMTRFESAKEWAATDMYFERMKMLERLFESHGAPFLSLDLQNRTSSDDGRIRQFIGV